jgi:catechol 2,3-dioxygenase-like lactoylglutathione lyase family enzyme
MLSAIVAVTLLVPDVQAVERAYQQVLDYQTVERGHVAADQAASWGAKALAGRDFVVLQPSSGEPVYLRMIETDTALGPAGELLYFTRMPAGVSRFGLGSAMSFVDRVFIVVLAVHDLRGTLDFYATTFGSSVTEPATTRVAILADAWGLPREQPLLLGIIRLPERFLIEVDEYPAGAAPRTAADGELPSGMAMVSFEVPSLEPYADRLLASPTPLAGMPYSGRRAGVMLGPGGEYIELIEGQPATLPAPASDDKP